MATMTRRDQVRRDVVSAASAVVDLYDEKADVDVLDHAVDRLKERISEWRP